MKNYVITIARGFGSGGKELANMLSEKLGIPWYDKQFYKMLEEYTGLDKSKFGGIDEKLRGPQFLKFLIGYSEADYILSPEEKNFVSDDNLYKVQAKFMKKIANEQSCIMVGKCANHILKDYDNVLSIYVEAPREKCVATTMDRLGITEEEAHRVITKTDKYRSDYYSYYTKGEKWTNPTLYDFVINTGRLSLEESAELIIQGLKIKGLME